MRTIVLLVVALALAAPAAAKELMLTTVCGADGCTSVPNAPSLRALVSLGPGGEAPDAAPHYGVTLRAEGSAGVVRSFLYVPSAGAMRVDDATSFWTQVPFELQPLLAQVTAGVEPYPASPGWGGAPAPENPSTWPLLVAPIVALAVLAAALRRVRRRRLAAVGLAAVTALTIPVLGAAKNWGYPRLCGPTGCKSSDAVLMSLPAGEAPTVPVPAPYYASRRSSRGWYIPSAHAMAPRAGSTFTLVTAEAAAAFRRLAEGLEPFPAPKLNAAFVGGRRVSGDPNTYLRLFAIESTGPAINAGSDWVPIHLRSKRDSPWTNGATYLAYSPSENLLQRGRKLIRVPEEIARRLDSTRALETLER